MVVLSYEYDWCNMLAAVLSKLLLLRKFNQNYHPKGFSLAEIS